MRKQAGFTLVELLAVIAIIGILAATAVPLYRTMQQRTYGREAIIMAKQIMDAQIMYFLEHNDKFYPEDSSTIEIYHNSPAADPNIADVKKKLNIEIPVDHHLDFKIYADNSEKKAYVVIESAGRFPLFKDGSWQIMWFVDRTGAVEVVIPY